MVMKNGSGQRLSLAAPSLPLVIPTEAQRSGGTCGSAALPWKCFSTKSSEVEGPAVSRIHLIRPHEQIRFPLYLLLREVEGEI
jgi:hypothetical protein